MIIKPWSFQWIKINPIIDILPQSWWNLPANTIIYDIEYITFNILYIICIYVYMYTLDDLEDKSANLGSSILLLKVS